MKKINKPQPEETQKTIKGNLYKLPKSPVPWGLLADQKYIKCGYCGRDVKIFSNRVYLPGDKRKYTMWYLCSSGCTESQRHRIQFIDKSIIKWMKKRIEKKVEHCNSNFEPDSIMTEFAKLSQIGQERKSLQTDLFLNRHSSEKILIDLLKVEKAYDTQKSQLDAFDPFPPTENPLVSIMMNSSVDDLLLMDINYLRKMYDLTVRTVRFFKEYLLLRAVSLTDDEHRITEGFGPQASINLRTTHRVANS